MTKNQIKDLGSRHIRTLLDNAGIEYKSSENMIQARCPCKQHNGDRSNTSAFSWRVDIGRWICWSHHCEEKFGSDVIGLMRSMYDLSFEQAVILIKDKVANLASDINYIVRTYQPSLYIHEALSENNLKFLKKDPQYLLDRNFDMQVLRNFQVGFWFKVGSYMHNRAVFPVRDHDGFLVGYTGRTVLPKDFFIKRSLDYKKWIHGRHYHQFPKPNEFHTGSILYNLCRAKQFIGDNKRIILVEGPLDGMRLEEAGIFNWVATFGTSFGYNHRTLLLQYNIKSILVAYDNDISLAGQEGFERVQRIIGHLFDVQKVDLPLGRDCGDLSAMELKEIINAY